jgi:hypothetical protein
MKWLLRISALLGVGCLLWAGYSFTWWNGRLPDGRCCSWESWRVGPLTVLSAAHQGRFWIEVSEPAEWGSNPRDVFVGRASVLYVSRSRFGGMFGLDQQYAVGGNLFAAAGVLLAPPAGWWGVRWWRGRRGLGARRGFPVESRGATPG